MTKLICTLLLLSSVSHAGAMDKLNKAIADNNMKSAASIIKSTDSLDQVDSEGMSPLMLAAAEGNIKMLDLILQQNPDLEFKNDVGDTALALAVSSDQEEAALKLIKAGAKVDIPVYSENGDTLLITASRSNPKLVSAILEKDKSSIDKSNRLGQTALAESIRFGTNQSVEILLKAGADTSVKTKDNQTLEQIAKTYHNKQALALLKKYKKKP